MSTAHDAEPTDHLADKDLIMTTTDTTTPAHASSDVTLPAPRTRGVSVGLVIALIIAALGIGFAVGSMF